MNGGERGILSQWVSGIESATYCSPVLYAIDLAIAKGSEQPDKNANNNKKQTV